MTFAALPLALLVAACVIPPLILLYFLKLRRQERTIPSTLLWMNAVQDLQANAPFQRLKPNLLLFLQLLALLLLLAAIAQPEWLGDVDRGTRTILLIDRSASMNAPIEQDGPTRLAEAKRQAMEYVDGMETGGVFNPLAESERVMVIGFSDHAEVYSRFTTSRAQLKQAIEAITLTHGSTRLAEALELARAYATVTDPENAGTSLTPTARIILLSDGRIADISSQVAKEPISYQRVGGDAGSRNAAIVAFDAERNYKDLTQISVYARVANFNPYAISATLLFSVGDQLIASRSVEIPAATVRDESQSDDESGNATAESSEAYNATPGLSTLIPRAVDVSFDFVQPQGVVLGVELDYADDLEPDNRAFVVIPPAKQLDVALVNRKSFVIESALGGIPFINTIHRMTGPQFEQLQEQGETQRYDVVIFDDYRPARLLPGRYLCFGALPPIEGFTPEGSESKVNVPQAWDPVHPLNHNVNYSNLYAQHVPMRIPDTARAVVEGTSGPMVAEISDQGVHAVVVPFAAEQSNWPWDINFVFFLQNAVDYLGHLGDAVTSESFHPGEAIVARLPQSATNIRLHFPPPSSDVMPLTPGDPSYTSYGPIELAGLYRVSWQQAGADEEQSQAVAVNMFDMAESDIRPAPVIKFPGFEGRIEASEGTLRKRELWPYFLIACLLVLMLEWWVYGRKAYV